MYAIIQTSGRQYQVSAGDIIKVDSIDTPEGETIEFDQVVLLQDDKQTIVGSPLVANAKVQAEVIEHSRDKKINIIKFKRRKHHLKRMGFRADITKLKITQILAN
jgi:large subunit ribosomal protein L21